jgi:hypothetical protein
VNAALSVAVGAAFVWLGMVLAISFLETPLKFRAPGVTLQIGLGIGRLVFRALNICECALATAIIVSLTVAQSAVGIWVAVAIAAVALLIQVLAVRPVLSRRSDATLAGAEGPRSHAHWVYVGLEIVKVVAVFIAGVLLLAT